MYFYNLIYLTLISDFSIFTQHRNICPIFEPEIKLKYIKHICGCFCIWCVHVYVHVCFSLSLILSVSLSVCVCVCVCVCVRGRNFSRY